MKIDKNILLDKLIDAFINYQYRLEHPMPSINEREVAINHYQTDAIFHTKVKSLACGVMRIVEDCIL